MDRKANELFSQGLGPRRAVLFDVDGVLLDSYPGYEKVWSRWCSLSNVDFATAWAATHGRRPVDTIAEVAPHLDPVAGYEALQAILVELEDHLPAFAGAPELVSSLPDGAWGVVTSGRRETVTRRFEATGLAVPQVLIDGDDVVTGKPAPDGYLAGAARLGVEPQCCLVVEDAPAGVVAGKAAGMRVLGIASTHGPGELALADQCVGSLEEAAPHIVSWLTGASRGLAGSEQPPNGAQPKASKTR
jgi:sugar-phosphatase